MGQRQEPPSRAERLRERFERRRAEVAQRVNNVDVGSNDSLVDRVSDYIGIGEITRGMNIPCSTTTVLLATFAVAILMALCLAFVVVVVGGVGDLLGL